MRGREADVEGAEREKIRRDVAAPAHGPADVVLGLQRSVGNAQVARLMAQRGLTAPARRLSRQQGQAQALPTTPAGAAGHPFGLDWSSSRRPRDNAMQSANVSFVVRYLSHSPSKNLTFNEAVHWSTMGIDIAVVWETTAGRALRGHDAGVADARDAAQQASAVGMPPGRPIYFAVDFDATRQQLTHEIAEYFRGVNEEIGVERTGVYGGLRTVSELFDAGLVAWGWQTLAWSRGRWDARAQLQQFRTDTPFGGISVDYDRAMTADFGQWRLLVGDFPEPDPDANVAIA